MSKRILITGATGFVGSHILETLMADESLSLIVACRNPSNLIQGFQGEIRQGDLRDKAYLETVVQDVDVICHAAAWTSLWGHAQESKLNFLEPSLNLIKAAKKVGVGQFIFPSTTSAAAPSHSSDARNEGVPRAFWPHLCNVIKIENTLREQVDTSFSSVTLRLGTFVGERYGVGLLPILLPRLKTHLVPWVEGGSTHLPLLDGKDIGQAFLSTINANKLDPHSSFNIVGSEQPTVRELITFIHEEFHYPKPHFSVPFSVAYGFAWLMEQLDKVVPWEPLITRSVVHLLEETHADNHQAFKYLGFEPKVHWKESVRKQIEELHQHQKKAMSMAAKLE